MKYQLRLVLLGVALLLSFNGLAQNMSINSNGAQPDASAMLDVQSTTQGLLMPRMTAAQVAAISSPAEGLIVYNTTDSTFNYYDGLAWITIQPNAGGGTGWNLDGNASGALDFLGTTNAQALRLFTDSTERMQIASDGSVGIGAIPLVNTAVRLESGFEVGQSINQTYTGANAQRGLLVTMNNAGTGALAGVASIVTAPVGNASSVGGVTSGVTANGTGIVNGISSSVQGSGSGQRFGISNSMTNPASNGSPVYGLRSDLDNAGAGSTFGTYTNLDGSGSGLQSAYHAVLNTTGNGDNYGYFASMNGSGTGDYYGLRINHTALGVTGTEYGVFVENEDINYFSGDVGIGITTPVRELHIHQPSTTFSYLQLTSASSGTTVNDGLHIGTSGAQAFIRNMEFGNMNFRTADSNRLVITGAGDIGIGTNAPTAQLDIITNSTLAGGIRLRGTTAAQVGPSLYLDADTRDWNVYASNNGASAGRNKFIIRDFTGATDLFTITPDPGRFGFGTTNPLTDIHMAYDSLLLRTPNNFAGSYFIIEGARINNGSGIGTIQFRNTDSNDGNTAYAAAAIESQNGGNSDDGDLRFYTANNTVSGMRMRIDNVGRVGIGVTNPTARLTVAGDVSIPNGHDYRYSTAKTKYHAVPTAAFNLITTNALIPGTTSLVAASTVIGGLYTSGGTAANDAFFTAPVYLPDSAVITELSARLYDADAIDEISCALFRQNHNTSVVNEIIDAGGTGAAFIGLGTNVSSSTIVTGGAEVVDNQNYSYYLIVTTKQDNSNLRLNNARITYQIVKAE